MPVNSLYWMQGTVTITFLGAGYFCIPINNFELCPGGQLNYFNSFDSFRLRIKDLLIGNIIAFSLDPN